MIVFKNVKGLISPGSCDSVITSLGNLVNMSQQLMSLSGYLRTGGILVNNHHHQNLPFFLIIPE